METKTEKIETLSAVEELARRVNADPTNDDFLFGAAVFCMDYHGGQWSVEYQALCEIDANLRDGHIAAIRHGRDDRANEWESARCWYRELKRSAKV